MSKDVIGLRDIGRDEAPVAPTKKDQLELKQAQDFIESKGLAAEFKEFKNG